MIGSRDIPGAVRALLAGELVGFPTETVYGLGADATNSAALHSLYAVKGRPAAHPVIVHLGSKVALDEWGMDVSDEARALAQEWWPGPLTVIVNAAPRVSRVATGGLETVGVRVPNHPVALELIDAFGGGVAAPSANRFGRVSPTTASAVEQEFGNEIAGVLDGGACTVGIESTIVDCTSETVRVLRPGAVTVEMISELLGVAVGIGGATRAPGTLAAHYAPNARVEVVETNAIGNRARTVARTGRRVGVIERAGEKSADSSGDSARDVVTLATIRSSDEYARLLYSTLRKADDLGVDVVLAAEPDHDGIGVAVADRLRRAESGR